MAQLTREMTASRSSYQNFLTRMARLNTRRSVVTQHRTSSTMRTAIAEPTLYNIAADV